MVELTQNLDSLILSAIELREIHPDWSSAMIEDYLNLNSNFLILSETVQNGATKVPAADEDNIIIFDSDGDLKDSGTSINQVSGIELIAIDTTITPDDGTIFVDTDAGDITITLVGEAGEFHRIVNVGSSGNLCILTSINNINGFTDDEPLYDSENLDLKFENTVGWY